LGAARVHTTLTGLALPAWWNAAARVREGFEGKGRSFTLCDPRFPSVGSSWQCV